MENQSSRTGIIVPTIILTAILVGGAVYFLQQNSIKELREEIQGLQKSTVEEPVIKKEVKTPEIKENTASLPAGVEWLTYSDEVLSFVYPKTFLGTPLQDPLDENSGRTEWKVSRQDNTIYIRPNFESPAAEFGSTYEIQIIDNQKDAEELHTRIKSATADKNLCIPLNDINVQGYSVCAFEQEVDEGLGRVGKYYAVMPEVENGIQTPPWIYIFDMSGGVYTEYIRSILISSIEIK